uniref:Uncharacterized protein n=1 Tax=Noctiluca scintillans TaxID=2966 RepID=A0A7S1A6Q4_NOCSC
MSQVGALRRVAVCASRVERRCKMRLPMLSEACGSRSCDGCGVFLPAPTPSSVSLCEDASLVTSVPTAPDVRGQTWLCIPCRQSSPVCRFLKRLGASQNLFDLDEATKMEFECRRVRAELMAAWDSSKEHVSQSVRPLEVARFVAHSFLQLLHFTRLAPDPKSPGGPADHSSLLCLQGVFTTVLR